MTPRGPMPLAEARELLRGSQVFVKGEGEIDGQYVLASDIMWRALLSLEDAAEFVEVASRLEWKFQPRGFNNTDLHKRYGDGIVPWLQTRLGGDGVLRNEPWCVVPCLLACGSPEAFDLAWRSACTTGRTPWGGVGDGDLVRTWSSLHPEVAIAELTRRVESTPRARAYLRSLGQPAHTPAIACDILALLEACALRLFDTRVVLWPPKSKAPLRIVGARDGGDWGLAIERIEGTRPSGIAAARVITYAYGSRVKGPVQGAAVGTRPLVSFAADDFQDRLGEPNLALPLLGLDASASIVAAISEVPTSAAPWDSEVFATLADAIEHGD